MAKTILPKGVKAPNFTGKTKPEPKPVVTPTIDETKPVEETPVEKTKVVETKPKTEPETEPTKKVETEPEQPKVEEPKPEEPKLSETKKEEPKPKESQPISGGLKPDENGNIPGYIKEEDIQDYEYLLKPKQKLLNGLRVFFPYFFAFLYNLLLVVALVALFTLPIVKLADATAVINYYGGSPTFNLVEIRNTILSTIGLGDKFDGLYSIAEIGIEVVMVNIADGFNGILIAVSKMFGFVTMAIFLVIMIIWYVIKLIHSLLALITVIFFKSKRKRVIDNFFFKNTHQFYNLGILDRDYTFIVFLLYSIFLLAFMNMKAILTLAGVATGQVADILTGIVIFQAFENTDLFNFGNIALLVVIGALLVIRIIYKLIVHGLSRKVKKTYVLKKKRKHKKAA